MSLTVGLGDQDQILFKCQAGCTQDQVREAFGLSWSDLASPHVPYQRKGSKYPRIYKPQPIRNERRQQSKTPEQLESMLRELEADADCRRGIDRYASRLGLPSDWLWNIGCRWKRIQVLPKDPNDVGELWYPERDGKGTIIGIGIRSWDSGKCFVTGSRRGLLYLPGVLDREGPVYLVEGLTDTVALLAMGLCVIGRPSNTGGVGFLAEIITGRTIIVVGENDQKENGTWPGRTGADQTARELSVLLNRPVSAALVPKPFKDTREWFQAPHAAGESLAEIYQKSLEVFATYPVVSQEVTDEEIQAYLIPFSEAQEDSPSPSPSPYTYPEERCGHPRHFLLKHKETNMLREQLTRCGCSSCSQCFQRKRRLRLESLLRHFVAVREAGGQLHCCRRTFTKKEWDSIRRSILRRQENFIRYRQVDDMFILISTTPFPGSVPLPFDQAETYAREASDNAVVEGKGKPFFSSSKQWAMCREKKESKYKRLGIIHKPPQAVKQLCDSYLGRGRIEQKRPADSDVLLDGFIQYAALDHENDKFVQMLLDKSQSLVIDTNDSDIFPPCNPVTRLFPAEWDDYYGWWMDPTG